MTPDVQGRIQVLRAKVADGSATLEECKEIVTLIRGDRVKAATVSESSRRAKAKAQIKSADEMLDELGGI